MPIISGCFARPGRRVLISCWCSNDWPAIDPYHTQAITFRAIENGYSLVRQPSTGLAITVVNVMVTDNFPPEFIISLTVNGTSDSTGD